MRSAPIAKTIPGQDPYAWMKDKNDPDTLVYLKAENDYADEKLAHTQPLQDKLYREMVSHIKETDMEVPTHKGDYYYYSRTEQGKQYRIYCRKKSSLDAPEEVLLDLNLLAQGTNYLHLGDFETSPNHELLAYTIDTVGSEKFSLFVKDLKTGQIVENSIRNIADSIEWANDNRHLFYLTQDETQRADRVFRHELNDSPQNDQLIYHEKDKSFSVDIEKSKSERFIYVITKSVDTSEWRYLDANQPLSPLLLIEARKKGHEYFVSAHEKTFLIVTNDRAKNFKVVRTPFDHPQRKYWKPFIPHRASIKIDEIEIFKDFLAVFFRKKGLQGIEIKNLKTGKTHVIPFDEATYVINPHHNVEYSSSKLRFIFSSFLTPHSVFDYDFKSKKRSLLKQEEVPGYDPSQYASERIWAKSVGQVQVPISIVYKKGLKKEGGHPLLLVGYGAYELSNSPYFNSDVLSLLDRGFVYAKAHIRGGGELGRGWYDDGKLFKKKNTFYDFIASAKTLIKQGYTSREKLVIQGGSAGGLLVGAVLNLEPDLFHAAIAEVPFVDTLNTMLDPSLPLTTLEYDEWGDPNQKKCADYIRSYSPYDNVRAQAYPHLLVTAGLNDPRVSYWEPAKWVAKLRKYKKDDHWLLLKTNLESGHFGKTGRYDDLKETALQFAFILDQLGITN